MSIGERRISFDVKNTELAVKAKKYDVVEAVIKTDGLKDEQIMNILKEIVRPEQENEPKRADV